VAVERGARVGVDVGSVRIGVASSDPDGILATPVETVPRGDRADGGVERIAEVVQETGAVCVYVGLPRHLSGSEGSASEAARNYGVHLARAVAPVPVRLIDERMSTVSAHRQMHASGRPGRRHRAVVDQAAAVVILQQALDAERVAGRPVGERVVDPDDSGGVEQQEVSW
jgi:putative Holliday junction resolvase